MWRRGRETKWWDSSIDLPYYIIKAWDEANLDSECFSICLPQSVCDLSQIWGTLGHSYSCCIGGSSYILQDKWFLGRRDIRLLSRWRNLGAQTYKREHLLKRRIDRQRRTIGYPLYYRDFLRPMSCCNFDSCFVWKLKLDIICLWSCKHPLHRLPS